MILAIIIATLVVPFEAIAVPLLLLVSKLPSFSMAEGFTTGWINTYHVQQFAAWIEKLKSIEEGDGTLLDNSMIIYGAGLSDGNLHQTNHDKILDSQDSDDDDGHRFCYGSNNGEDRCVTLVTQRIQKLGEALE